MMARINRQSERITTNHDAAFFLALFVAVVAWRAQRLPIVTPPEQFLITAMGDAMINHTSRHQLVALLVIFAQRILGQELITSTAPLSAIQIMILIALSKLRPQLQHFRAIRRITRRDSIKLITKLLDLEFDGRQ